MKFILLCLAIAAPLLAQPRALNTYTATCTLTLSSSAAACTIQQPASNARNVQLVSAYVYSTAAITITQERNGTAATATGVTETAVNPDISDTNTANVFTASDVGSGTTIATAIPIAASSSQTLDLSDIQLRGSGTSKNYTIRTSSATATVTVIIKWREY